MEKLEDRDGGGGSGGGEAAAAAPGCDPGFFVEGWWCAERERLLYVGSHIVVPVSALRRYGRPEFTSWCLEMWERVLTGGEGRFTGGWVEVGTGRRGGGSGNEGGGNEGGGSEGGGSEGRGSST